MVGREKLTSDSHGAREDFPARSSGSQAVSHASFHSSSPDFMFLAVLLVEKGRAAAAAAAAVGFRWGVLRAEVSL